MQNVISSLVIMCVYITYNVCIYYYVLATLSSKGTRTTGKKAASNTTV
jgi:hypothetical protein